MRPSVARRNLAMLPAASRLRCRIALQWAARASSGVDAARLGLFCATGRTVCVCVASPQGGFFRGDLSGLRFASAGVRGERVLAPAVLAVRGCRRCAVGVFEWYHRTDFLRRHSPCFVWVEGPRGLQARREARVGCQGGAPLSPTESCARCTRVCARVCVCTCVAGMWPPSRQA